MEKVQVIPKIEKSRQMESEPPVRIKRHKAHFTAATRRKDFYIVSLLLLGVFSLASAGGVIYLRYDHELLGEKENEVVTRYITSVEDFPKSSETLLNDHYILTKDLDYRVPFATEKQKFTGDFEGNGHLISVKKIEMLSPFFAHLRSGSSVRHLGFRVEEAPEDITAVFGLLAGRNEGRIEDCYVRFDVDVPIGDKVSVGGLVGINEGVIRHSYAFTLWKEDAAFVHKFAEGSLAGTILPSGSVLSSLGLSRSLYLQSNYDAFIEGSASLPAFGTIAGEWDPAKNANDSALYAYSPENCLFIDRQNTNVSFLSDDSALSTVSFYIGKLTFDRKIWVLPPTVPDLPELIKDSVYQYQEAGK